MVVIRFPSTSRPFQILGICYISLMCRLISNYRSKDLHSKQNIMELLSSYFQIIFSNMKNYSWSNASFFHKWDATRSKFVFKKTRRKDIKMLTVVKQMGYGQREFKYTLYSSPFALLIMICIWDNFWFLFFGGFLVRTFFIFFLFLLIGG